MNADTGDVQVRWRCSLAEKHWPSENCPCRNQDGWLYEWRPLALIVDAAIAAERERCAKIVDYAARWLHRSTCEVIAARIRSGEGIEPISGMPESSSPNAEDEG